MENSSCWDFSGVYSSPDSPDPGCVKRFDMRQIPGTSCYCDDEAKSSISAEMERADPGRLHLIDSGNYHYLTWFFLRRIREKSGLQLAETFLPTQAA